MKKYSLIGLSVFLSYPFILQYLGLGLFWGEVGFWLLFALIMLWIYFMEKKTIASIGWKKLDIKTILSGIGLGAILFLFFGIITTSMQALGLEINQDVAKEFASQPYWVLLLIVLRAGIVEEVLYRGYAFERLYDLTGSKFLAGLIPVILFTLVHLPWGVGHLVFVFFAGALFMCVYVAKRSLGLVVIAHFTTDVIAMLVLPLMVEA